MVDIVADSLWNGLESDTIESLEMHSILDGILPFREKSSQLATDPQGVVAYTDGACLKNPGGPAGWAALFWTASSAPIDGAQSVPLFTLSGHIPKAKTTTNNRAEISAVLAVLLLAPSELPLHIYSDSEYTINVAKGVFKMKANQDLWAVYKLLLSRRTSAPEFSWVRGHAGQEHNELADRLAGIAAWNGDVEGYDSWQNSQAREAHNPSAEPASAQSPLHQQVLDLQKYLDGTVGQPLRIAPNERTFINDMAKRLRNPRFEPSEKQINWLKALIRKYGSIY